MGLCQGRDADCDEPPFLTPAQVNEHLKAIMSDRVDSGEVMFETRLPWKFDSFAMLHIKAFENLE